MGGRSLLFSQEELVEIEAALLHLQGRISSSILLTEEPNRDYAALHKQHKTVREALQKVRKELNS